jgi:hypothetical protein
MLHLRLVHPQNWERGNQVRHPRFWGHRAHDIVVRHSMSVV